MLWNIFLNGELDIIKQLSILELGEIRFFKSSSADSSMNFL